MTRDKLGRITRKSETIAGTTDVHDYDYDRSDHLTEVKKNGTVISKYTYDSNDNKLSYAPSGSAPIEGMYDDQDRLLQYGDVTYQYNLNGQLISKTYGTQTTTYQYDSLGNLSGVRLPDGTEIEYVLDGLNRRIGRKVNGVLIQGFLYRDNVDPIAELDGSNNVVSLFVYASRPNVPDYMVKGGATYRIISDHLGSPRLVVDTETGSIAQRIDYDEYGRVLTDTNPGFQPFGFAGGVYDRDTGLVQFGARDYDAQSGRWTTKDPLLLSSGNLDLCAYVSGDPVNWYDPPGALTVGTQEGPVKIRAFDNVAGEPHRYQWRYYTAEGTLEHVAVHEKFGAHYSFGGYHDYPFGKDPRVVYPSDYVFENRRLVGHDAPHKGYASWDKGGGTVYREVSWNELKRQNPKLAKKLIRLRYAGMARGELKLVGRVLGSPHLQSGLIGWEIGEAINRFKPGGPMPPTMGESIQQTLGFNAFWNWYYTGESGN